MRLRLPWILGASVLLSTPLATSGKALARNRVETPDYTVVSTHATFEIRRYSGRLVAEVSVEGTAREASSRGFRILANFIFGANDSAESIEMTAPVDRRRDGAKIAMTAPVDRTRDGERWVIAFTMPSQYRLDTLPRPKDDRIRIRELAPTTYAVMRFSGAPAEDVVQRRTQTLIAEVARAGYQAQGLEATYARYDPPWTPSFLRRNEIHVSVSLPGPDPAVGDGA